jgi:putative transposase
MAIEKELLDRLLADDLIGETGLLKQLTKALLERVLEAELRQR